MFSSITTREPSSALPALVYYICIISYIYIYIYYLRIAVVIVVLNGKNNQDVKYCKSNIF